MYDDKYHFTTFTLFSDLLSGFEFEMIIPQPDPIRISGLTFRSEVDQFVKIGLSDFRSDFRLPFTALGREGGRGRGGGPPDHRPSLWKEKEEGESLLDFYSMAKFVKKVNDIFIVISWKPLSIWWVLISAPKEKAYSIFCNEEEIERNKSERICS